MLNIEMNEWTLDMQMKVLRDIVHSRFERGALSLEEAMEWEDKIEQSCNVFSKQILVIIWTWMMCLIIVLWFKTGCFRSKIFFLALTLIWLHKISE